MAFGIAVCGLNHWYTAFGVLDNALAYETTKLVGIWDADAARREEVSERYPQALVPVSADELFDHPDVQLVAVCAATNHAPVLCRCALGAGKHVLSVKPAARSLTELDELLGFARTTDRFFGSFEGMQRLQPRHILLQELVQSGVIGTPLSYHQVGHGGLPAPWPGQQGPSWWTNREQVPGGAWIDHAIYAVDLARFIFGGEVDHATGLIEKRVHTDLGVEDYGASLMRLQPAGGGSSVTLLFEDTWATEKGGGVHRQQIIGTKGSIQPDTDGNGWLVRTGDGETTHTSAPSLFFRLDTLAHLLTGGNLRRVPFGPVDARANLAACLAVYEAAPS